MVDGGGQIVVPSKELREVQNQERFPRQAGPGGGKTQLGAAAATDALHARGGVAKTVTSHAIVGKSFAELIDHDEEDAHGITTAILTKQTV